MYNKIPEFLKSKVIIVTGSMPGVGKSYTKNYWYNLLSSNGYKVFNDGTTQKAASEMTVHERNRLAKGADLGSAKLHPLVNGFYFIDEAWMWGQQDIDKIISKYPNMCFVLFGDPLQLSLAELNHQDVIHKFDFGFNLTRNYRSKDEELYNALNEIKSGKIPYQFIHNHTISPLRAPENALQICLRNDTRDRGNKTNKIEANQIYRSYKYSMNEKGEFLHENTPKFWKNGELWRIVRIDEIEQIYITPLDGHCETRVIDKETLYKYFEYSPFINVHKAQGDTIKSDTTIIIDIDDFIYKDLPRQMYVALSRAESSNQIFFLSDSAGKFVQRTMDDAVFWPKLESNLDKTKLTDCTSDDLCVETIDELFNLFEKNALQLRRIYPAKSLAKTRSSAVLSPCDESFSNKSSGTDEDMNGQDLTPQGCDAFIDISKGPEYKRQRDTVTDWLRKHKGIGYSDRWNESQKAYADFIRDRYTVFGKFVAKTEENEQKAIDEKNRGIAYSKGLKPEETEVERKAKKALSSRKSRFYAKMFKEGKSVSEIDNLWEKKTNDNAR